jgi:hypothetical protein
MVYGRTYLRDEDADASVVAHDVASHNWVRAPENPDPVRSVWGGGSAPEFSTRGADD